MTSRLLTPLQRLLSHIEFDLIGGCWLWFGADCKGGYGMFRIEGHSRLAHRVSWTLHNGPIPKDMDVLHRCDTPPCINPAHLFLGDDFVNARDRVAKGRHAGLPRGAANRLAKLTENAVLAIRAISGETHKTIAARFGVARGTVGRIRARKLWTHI